MMTRLANIELRNYEFEDEDDCEFLVLHYRDGEEELMELEFVQDLMNLRSTDLDAYEHLWQTLELLLERTKLDSIAV